MARHTGTNSQIINCYNTGQITGSGKSNIYVAGIIGESGWSSTSGARNYYKFILYNSNKLFLL